MKTCQSAFTSEADHLKFFDSPEPQSSNDEGKAPSVVDGSDLSSEFDTADIAHNLYLEKGVTSTQVDDNSISEDNRHNVSSPSRSRSVFQPNEIQTPGPRRSSKKSKLPAKLNDYVINSSVRYGIEKFVFYSMLSESNMCFATNLNKSVEPSCYEDAMCDTNWIDAMNNEIEALNRNNT
ncbi:hypothetical protein Tco_0918581 [Tanacetum coccineum]